jgi:hypothetical protein
VTVLSIGIQKNRSALEKLKLSSAQVPTKDGLELVNLCPPYIQGAYALDDLKQQGHLPRSKNNHYLILNFTFMPLSLKKNFWSPYTLKKLICP